MILFYNRNNAKNSIINICEEKCCSSPDNIPIFNNMFHQKLVKVKKHRLACKVKRVVYNS